MEVAATGLECEGCTIENRENEDGTMDVAGSGGRLLYTGVEANLPGCVVEDPASGAETVRTEPLKFTTTSAIPVTIEPESGSTLAVIHLTGEECVLPGEFPINDYVKGTANGATLEVETEEGELEFAFTGEPAYLEGEATLSAGETGNESHHPLAVVPVAEGITAFTCAKGDGKEDFADAHCDEAATAGSGEYGHGAIATGKAKEVELTNAETESETTDSADATIEASVVGVEAKITATKVRGSGTIENYEPSEAVGKVKGQLAIEFSNLHVDKPSGCEVAGPIEAAASFESVEEGEGMGIELEPEEGATFFDLTFEGEECALDSITAHVKGTALATGGAGGTAEGSGATLAFEPAHESLTVGKGKASIASTTTLRLKESSPIALTTVK